MPVDSAVLVFFPVMVIGDSQKKAHNLRIIGVKLEFCSLLSTRLGRCDRRVRWGARTNTGRYGVRGRGWAGATGYDKVRGRAGAGCDEVHTGKAGR